MGDNHQLRQVVPARHRDFVRLWAAQGVSAFGSRITRTALPVIAILLVTADPVQGCSREQIGKVRVGLGVPMRESSAA